MTVKILGWDEVGSGIGEFNVTEPEGFYSLTPEDRVKAIDAANQAEMGNEYDAFDLKVRQVGDTYILDGYFGQDKEFHTYYNAVGNIEAMRELAEIEWNIWSSKHGVTCAECSPNPCWH